MYAVEPILKYVKPNSTIWCPFDKESSWYVKRLRKEGHTVIATHIDDGVDFLKCGVYDCDYIISAPPYSIKEDILERLFSIGKPFAMLLFNIGLFEGTRRFGMFKNNEFELLFFDKRVAFYSPSDRKYLPNPPYQSLYVCHKMLPENIALEKLDKIYEKRLDVW